MVFTIEDLKKIEEYIRRKGAKDTDFPSASELNGNEIISFVQNGVNVQANIGILRDASNFININNITKSDSIYSLEEAIKLVPTNLRIPGTIITFLVKESEWIVFQFVGESLDDWLNIEMWKNVFQGEAEPITNIELDSVLK